MKARIQKKLCKRLLEIAPSHYEDAWLDKGEPSDLAYEQSTRVSHIWSVGGGVDSFGEGCEAYTFGMTGSRTGAGMAHLSPIPKVTSWQATQTPMASALRQSTC